MCGTPYVSQRTSAFFSAVKLRDVRAMRTNAREAASFEIGRSFIRYPLSMAKQGRAIRPQSRTQHPDRAVLLVQQEDLVIGAEAEAEIGALGRRLLLLDQLQERFRGAAPVEQDSA